MRGKPYVLIAITVVTLTASLLLSRIETDQEASFGSAIEFLSGIVRDVDHVGLTLTRVSAEREMEIGSEINELMMARSGYGRLDQYAVYQPYVEEVGNVLLEQAGRKDIGYHFRVIRSSEINAFAVAGGYIYVTTAMLDFLQTEAELAGVLAHEISHVDLRHCIQRLQYQLKLRKLVGKDLATIAGVGYSLVLLGFSEEVEREADINGIQLAARSGYDPNALLGAFQRLKERLEPAASGSDDPSLMLEEIGSALGKALKQYFASHPSWTDRLHYTARVNQQNRREWQHRMFYRGKVNYETASSKKRTLFAYELREYDTPGPAPGRQLDGAIVPGPGRKEGTPGPAPDTAQQKTSERVHREVLDAYRKQCSAYKKNKDYSGALGVCTVAIELDPDHIDTKYPLYDRALAYRKGKRYDLAILDYDRALELDPRYAWAYNGKAWLLATCDDTEFRDGNEAVLLAETFFHAHGLCFQDPD